MRFFITLFAAITAIAISCNNTDVPRPAPLDPPSNWITYCSQRIDCGLCTSQSNCAFCPTTNKCVYYSPSNQTAKTSCPTLIQQPELCK